MSSTSTSASSSSSFSHRLCGETSCRPSSLDRTPTQVGSSIHFQEMLLINIIQLWLLHQWMWQKFRIVSPGVRAYFSCALLQLKMHIYIQNILCNQSLCSCMSLDLKAGCVLIVKDVAELYAVSWHISGLSIYMTADVSRGTFISITVTHFLVWHTLFKGSQCYTRLQMLLHQ